MNISKIRRQCWIDKPWVCRIEERDNTIPTQSLFFFSVFGARHSSKHWFSSGSFAKRHLLHFLSLFFSEQPEKQHYTYFFFQPKKDEMEIINKNKRQHVAADEKASKIWLMQSQEDWCGPYRRKKNLIIIITATDFPAIIWPLKKEHKNFILITQPSPNLSCVASSLWNFLVRLVPQRSDFAGKPMLALRNFGFSLRLAYSVEKAYDFSSLFSSEYLHHFLATIWQLIVTIYTAQKQ